MKKGPPKRAVMTPTGISTGQTRLRAAVSAARRSPAPTRAEAGTTIAMVGADQASGHVGGHQADEVDGLR